MTDTLTVQEAAEEAKVSQRTMYDLLRQGKVKAHKFGGVWRIRSQDLWAATLYSPRAGDSDPMPRPNRSTFDDELEKAREKRRRRAA